MYNELLRTQSILPTINLQQITHEILHGNKIKIIDVRSPLEFNRGHIPFSYNFPVLTDYSRHLVGTCYKKEGKLPAVQLGYQLVMRDNCLDQLLMQIKALCDIHFDHKFYFTCFRGGLRSKSIQFSFWKKYNILLPRLEGGYKSFRSLVLSDFQQFIPKKNFLVLTGRSGSGKTKLLNALKNKIPLIDLEELAKHRGSAFGSYVHNDINSQSIFENNLWLQLFSISTTTPILIENEGRTIGSCQLPLTLYSQMAQSPMILLNEDISARVDNIYQEYILDQKHIENNSHFIQCLDKIRKKLGGVQYSNLKELLNMGTQASFKEVIKTLLLSYYDPFYLSNEKKNKKRFIFQGNYSEVSSYIEKTYFNYPHSSYFSK